MIKIDYMIGDKVKTFNISNKKITRVCGIPFGNDKEQQPRGIKPLFDWLLRLF